MPDTAPTPPPAPADGAGFRHLLSAVHQALELPVPDHPGDELSYLRRLEQRVRIARASIGRLIGDPASDPLDFMSEGDHILHQLADLPPDTYRH